VPRVRGKNPATPASRRQRRDSWLYPGLAAIPATVAYLVGGMLGLCIAFAVLALAVAAWEVWS
jgi:hypothetical protein